MTFEDDDKKHEDADDKAPVLRTTNSSAPEGSKPFTSSVRQWLGQWTVQTSEIINDNLILARYGTIVTVGLLSAYGLYKTPLFFRYHSVSDIPCMSFHNRHTLHGRIVHAKKKEIGWPSNSKHTSSNMADEVEQPILLYVHHLSPVQRLLNRSTFNFFTRQNISASSKHIEEERDDLIKVELAGIKQPISYSAPSFQEQEGAWLSAFAQNQSHVTFQLITRRVVDINSLQQEGITKDAASSNFNSLSVVDRLTASTSDTMSTMLDKEQTAICKVYFRPPDSIFRKDLATSLVQFGRAEVLPSGLYLELQGKRTTDRSDKLADIQSDVSYMGQLVKAEYSAIKEKKGLWANDDVRERKENFIKEVLADEVSLWKKIWSWLKEKIA